MKEWIRPYENITRLSKEHGIPVRTILRTAGLDESLAEKWRQHPTASPKCITVINIQEAITRILENGKTS